MFFDIEEFEAAGTFTVTRYPGIAIDVDDVPVRLITRPIPSFGVNTVQRSCGGEACRISVQSIPFE